MRARALAAAAAVLLALALLAGCGTQSDPPGPGIPRKSISALNLQLDLVYARLKVARKDPSKIGSCEDIETKSYPDIEAIVNRIPSDTDTNVIKALNGSLERLRELTNQDCSRVAEDLRQKKEAQQTDTETNTVPTETTDTTTETTPTETTDTETNTVPTDTTPTQTTPTTPGTTTPASPGQGGGASAPEPKLKLNGDGTAKGDG